ncbi:division/cell wall cluster transcriptional repressor MraZ [Natranaerobius thermophilus]|uniref:Transcriptional regulator MraZ n=1 Tax=Natranaerobius thermophilus (strain ATCC BAA-1301 / DSM 18059 / JW/NM-WN-LF) TaxID=457570 RepID=MRAZ_NATTJ|nr:RecName: Full=Transcriptional regulator MraZ [Natranaerobius thermophilus JW/NM-WN-LF]ACB84878.1 MraZ protein [Natranaerobius thermophilus JW/NM-WN-LF]
MFMGEFRHSLDSKGRVIVPAKFRKGLGDNFVATRGLDNCIFVYPMNEWKVLEEKIRQLPLTKSDARAFSRFFLSGASECELDKQGRISLPSNLRDYAALQKDVVIIGVSNRVEIWSQEKWDNYQQQAESSFENIAEEIVDFDI